MEADRFSAAVAHVIAFARYEAHQAGSSTIEPQHLILALARVAKPLFADADEITKAIRRDFPPYPTYHNDNQLPLGRAALRIFNNAAAEATRGGSFHIGPEHLLNVITSEGSWGSFIRKPAQPEATSVRA